MFDLTEEPVRHAALQRMLATGQSVCTDFLTLVRPPRPPAPL